MIGDRECEKTRVSCDRNGMKRLSEENSFDDGNSNSECGKSWGMPRQKRVRVLDTIGEKCVCLQEMGWEIQGEETESHVICVDKSCFVMGKIRGFDTIDTKVSDSEELDREIGQNHRADNLMFKREEFCFAAKQDRILSETNACSSGGTQDGEVEAEQINKAEVSEESHQAAEVRQINGIEVQGVGRKKLGWRIEEDQVLRRIEGCGSEDKAGEEIEKGDGERDLGNVGLCTAAACSSQSGSIMMVDHVRGKENSNFDLNVEQMDFDLNLPAWEAEEGGHVRGCQECTQSGPVIAQGVGIIHISSDESEDDSEQVTNERDARRKDKEIDKGFADGSTESFHMGFVTMELGTSDRCSSMSGGRRYTREEKGKAKIVDSWLSLTINSMHLDMVTERQELINSADSGSMKPYIASQPEETTWLLKTENLEFRRERERTSAPAAPGLRQRVGTDKHTDILNHAHQFARFNSHQENYRESFKQERKMQSTEGHKNFENFSGPFSIAMKLIKEQTLKHSAQELINWKPLKGHDPNILMHFVPSLLDLSVEVLAKNAEGIISLAHVPDSLKHRLTDRLCDFRQMNIHALDLLVQGSPTEIRIKDCSWITEEQFTKTFRSFDTKNLKVLQLDLCGQCILGDSLGKTLVRSPNSLPDLAIMSLKGACRLTNNALKELVASAPAIQSLNLSQCSLLTSNGIYLLADSLGNVLRELYIDNCQRIDAMLIAPAMKKFKHLEVLSVAGIQTVCDEFLINIIIECGRNIKELDLADCLKLTNISMKAIGNTCSGLRSLNMSNLHKLTDLAIQYLANGCQSIHTLKLLRNSFSDEAIAAFLETSGKSLKELSLNNVGKVGPNTALSLGKCSKELLSLDLSWCRKITNESLGLIVDSCLSLKLLKLFGCTQISNEFLNGHSNSLVQIIGLNMTPVLKHLNVLEPEVVYLRYSPVTFSSNSQSLDHSDI